MIEKSGWICGHVLLSVSLDGASTIAAIESCKYGILVREVAWEQAAPRNLATHEQGAWNLEAYPHIRWVHIPGVLRRGTSKKGA